MSRKQTMETVEEMVAWISKNLYFADKRWALDSNMFDVWDNPDEGEAWEKKMNELRESYPKYDQRQSLEYQKKLQHLQDARPTQSRMTRYYLRESDGGWNGIVIYLSEDLGAKVDEIWTKKPSRWSNFEERVGRLTMNGILKRLGRTDIGKIIEQAKIAEKLQAEKNSRNYCRRELKKLAEQAERHMKSLGLDSSTSTIADLLALVEE